MALFLCARMRKGNMQLELPASGVRGGRKGIFFGLHDPGKGENDPETVYEGRADRGGKLPLPIAREPVGKSAACHIPR